MKGLKKLFLNQSLKTRITFLYTLFAVLIISILTLYAYHFTADLLKEKETSILQDSLEYLERTVSARIESVNEEYINLFDDAAFWQLYLDCTAPKTDKAEQVRLNNAFQTYFMDIKLRNHDLIESVYLYSSDGNVYSSEYDYQVDYEEFKETSFYALGMEEKNKIHYQSMEEEDFFYILRSFYFQRNENGDTAKPNVGYLSDADEDYSILVFSLKKKYLQKEIRTEAKKRQTGIFIVDETGAIVVQEGDWDWLSDEQYTDLLGEVTQCVSRGYEGKFERNRVGIHMRQIDLMNWSIVYVYDMNILYQQAGQIQKAAIIMFAAAAVCVFLIASFVSRTVTKPIRALAKSMDEAVDNNMEVAFSSKYNDEVAYLGRKFSELMHRVSCLLQEVKRAEKQKHVEELKALQAQINPHFLYNTLDMVYWLAKIEKQDRIANLIADLADFFRLSLNKGEDITTVKKEVEHATKYMEIQSVRMDNKFDYEISVDPQLAESRVPKLILQPFIENVLLHGFENISYQGHIKLTVTREGENIVFCVEDNGKGMEEELRRSLNRGMQPERSGNDSHGYAIENVRERIRLYSGNDCGVQFDTRLEEGTRVQIWFPYGFAEETENDKDDGR